MIENKLGDILEVDYMILNNTYFGFGFGIGRDWVGIVVAAVGIDMVDIAVAVVIVDAV
jgi:hypothetical protein